MSVEFDSTQLSLTDGPVPEIPPYDEKSFWPTVKRTAKLMGTATLTSAFTLYYALQDERTPAWAKTIVAGALAYLIFPADAIPDMLPAVGFCDDLGAIVAATAMVVSHIRQEHKEQAVQQVEDLLG